jgi:hypothetical protein
MPLAVAPAILRAELVCFWHCDTQSHNRCFPTRGSDAGQITVGGELNKLANNVADHGLEGY